VAAALSSVGGLLWAAAAATWSRLGFSGRGRRRALVRPPPIEALRTMIGLATTGGRDQRGRAEANEKKEVKEDTWLTKTRHAETDARKEKPEGREEVVRFCTARPVM
jgi:hypothetical protein